MADPKPEDDKPAMEEIVKAMRQLLEDAPASSQKRPVLPKISEDFGALSLSKEKPMTDREMVADKIAAVEARTETKIARLEGKMDLVLEAVRNSREEARENRRAIIANSWAIGIGMALLIVAVVAAFPVFFGIATQLRDFVHDEMARSQAIAPSIKPGG